MGFDLDRLAQARQRQIVFACIGIDERAPIEGPAVLRIEDDGLVKVSESTIRIAAGQPVACACRIAGSSSRLERDRANPLSEGRAAEALLIRKPQDECQGRVEPSHLLVAETPDLLPDPFASDCDRLIGHHL